MVPNGWERKPIKELCESIIDCVNKTAKHVDYTTSYKMIRTTNVRHGKVDTENVRYVDEDVYKQWIRRGAPQDGDIIFTREAPVGEAGILENSEGIFLGQRTMMYRVNPEVANNRFVFYSLMSGYCQKQIQDLSNGGTVAHMRVPDCGEIIINSPPLLEQQKIAKILFTWDKAISTTECLIENSTQQKKALMQQLLTGKKRLLDESGKRFEDAWEEVKLSNLGSTFNGLIGKTKVDFGSGKKYIPYMNIFKNTFIDTGNLDYVNIDANEKQSAVQFGDVFFTTSSETPDEVGMSSVLLTKTEESIYLNSFCFGFRPFKINEIAPAFIGYMLRSSHVRRKIAILAQGATRYNLSKVQLLKISITLPSLEEQQKIATVLTNADKEIELLEQQLADLQQEKKALMQVLLTGKKRVLVDGEVV